MNESVLFCPWDDDEVQEKYRDKYDRLMFLAWYGEFLIDCGDHEWTWPAYEMN